MPCFIRKLTPDGIVPVDYSADSLADAAQYEPDNGIYTVTNTYQVTKVLKLGAHLDRMEDSARRAGFELELDRPRLRTALREMILQANYGDVRFRVTVTADKPDTFIISLEPFSPPSQKLIEEGVHCITAPNSARHSAEMKATSWMHDRKRLADAMPAGIYDTFLLDADGNMMEGLGANFYAILSGTLRTAGTGVLKGIAQQIVLEVAPDILPIQMDAVHVSQIGQLEESFLTSSSRGIIPVVAIDGILIGAGVPGPLTRQLIAAYRAWVDAHLETL